MKTIFCENPFTKEKIMEAFFDTDKSINEKFKLARDMNKKLRLMSKKERIYLVLKILDSIENNKEEISNILCNETGLLFSYCILLVEDTIKRSKWFIDNSSILDSKVIDLGNGLVNEVRRVPRGVVMILSSWNSPLSQTFWAAIPAIISGNTVIHKASIYSTAVSKKIQEIIDESGIMKGIFQTVYGNKEIVRLCIDNKPDFLILSGGYKSGIEIAKLCSRYNIRTSMELGGKDYIVVCEDADIDKSTSAVIKSFTKLSGQSCNSVERLFVHRNIREKFLSVLEDKFNQIKVGNPRDINVTMGPLSNKASFQKYKEILNDALLKGAKITLKLDISNIGYCVSPILLSDCTEEMLLEKEEIFSPIIPFYTFTEFSEVHNKILNSEYGLGLSIWTKKIKKFVDSYIKLCDYGTIVFNELPRTNVNCPWGGFKKTGNGRILSEECYLELTDRINLRYNNNEK